MNEFDAGIAVGKLEMFDKVSQTFFNIVAWADENIEHDSSKESCDVCTLLEEFQWALISLGMREGSRG